MKSSLLGLELRAEEARLSVVDRQARVLGSVVELLDGPVGHWWNTHPEERFQGVMALLERAATEGLLVAGRIAGIGISCEPGLVLLDREFNAIPPREIPWGEILHDVAAADRSPGLALRRLGEMHPRWARRVGAVLDVVDFLRFRMTGALATHIGFAWGCDLASSPSTVESWRLDVEQLTGVHAEAFPPIFTPSCRVGMVAPEVIERTGIAAGVPMNAGSSPEAAELLVAAEPVPGRRIALIRRDEAQLWERRDTPLEWDRDSIPLGVDSVWYRRQARGAASRGPVPDGWLEDTLVLDFRDDIDPEPWPEELPSDVTVTADAGGPSASAAVQAGLGLGWWRDPRTLWRKRRPPVAYSEWRRALHETEQAAGAVDDEIGP